MSNVDGPHTCSVIGLCGLCDNIVCWEHHIDIAGSITFYGPDDLALVKGMMNPMPGLARRCRNVVESSTVPR